jgi:hypothetical protein
MAPWAESPRPVGRDIVESLFPAGQDGRIPVVAIVGYDSGQSAAAARHLTALLAVSGIRAGYASEQEVVLEGRRWVPTDKTPHGRAEMLFQNPMVDVSILGTTPRELVEVGFGNDRCDVAMVLNFSDDSLRVVRNALTPRGILVWPLSGGGNPQLPAERIIRFGEGDCDRDPLSPGYGAAATRALVGQRLRIGFFEHERVDLRKLPVSAFGDRDAIYGALAAGLALGQNVEALRTHIRSLRDQPAEP